MFNNLTIEERILIFSLVITVLFHIVFILIAWSGRRFQKFHDSTQRLLDIGMSIRDYKPKKYELWDNAVLNQCEYIAYLVRKWKISYKLLSGFLDDAIIDYYDKILRMKEHKKELKDKNCYVELKRLYKRLKKDKAKKDEKKKKT